MPCNESKRAGVRLAFIVSHPIQYYVPLYRRLAQHADLNIKVFYTWHDGRQPKLDRGFRQEVQWDIPLLDGYESELVSSHSTNPGSHRFFGLHNPDLMQRVLAFRPDAVHLTGYAYYSHLFAIWRCGLSRIPLLFRGDSHLLDSEPAWRRWIKVRALRQIFKRTTSCLYVGAANRNYYLSAGVPSERLIYCPHSIEVTRFSDPSDRWEREAAAWRDKLQIEPDQLVLLFAGKFEPRKRPLELMKAMLGRDELRGVLIMVGGGELAGEVQALAVRHPSRFRVLPFQNQSRMPAVYRLGDVVILPSAFGETWGLAVNEALACGRPVLVSDRVGCATDLIEPGLNGEIFEADNWQDFGKKLHSLQQIDWHRRRAALRMASRSFDIAATEAGILTALTIMQERS